MNQQQFEQLVAGLEQQARENPGGYRGRVLALALLGYGYIFGVLAVLVFLLWGIGLWLVASKGNTLVLKLGVIILGFAFIVLRALWVRLDAPQGRYVTRRECPRLFELIDEVRRHLRGPKVHRVLMTDELNAAIVQVPRLGLFGWQKNYLILGLPLMRVLTPDQFKAVLAHEYGHLSGAHGRFSSWIYRVRKTWNQVLSALEREEHWGRFVFNGFFSWYSPYFNAYSFVLARANEFEADACSADVTSRRVAGETLVSVHTKSTFVDRAVWPKVYAQADDHAAPKVGLHGMLPVALAQDFAAQAPSLLEEELARRTDYLDTHPSLADRLAALGIEAGVPAPMEVDAATAYLGEAQQDLAAHFESQWQERVAGSWREHFESSQAKKSRLAALDGEAAQGPLADDALWRRALLVDELRSGDEALALYEELATRNPGHAGAVYMVGKHLLQQNQDEGLERIRQAIALDDELMLSGYRLIYDYLKAHGRADEAEAIREKAIGRSQLEEQAEAERSSVSIKDRMQPHGLAEADLEALRDRLRMHWQVQDAHLVSKVVQHLPERPLRVLAVDRQPGDSELTDDVFMQELAAALELPPGYMLVLLTPEHGKLRKAIRKVEGAHIYNRRTHYKPGDEQREQ